MLGYYICLTGHELMNLIVNCKYFLIFESLRFKMEMFVTLHPLLAPALLAADSSLVCFPHQVECTLVRSSSQKLAFLPGTSESLGRHLSMFCLKTVKSRSVWAFSKLDIYWRGRRGEITLNVVNVHV